MWVSVNKKKCGIFLIFARFNDAIKNVYAYPLFDSESILFGHGSISAINLEHIHDKLLVKLTFERNVVGIHLFLLRQVHDPILAIHCNVR